jgi:hypothetical protein
MAWRRKASGSFDCELPCHPHDTGQTNAKDTAQPRKPRATNPHRLEASAHWFRRKKPLVDNFSLKADARLGKLYAN